MNKAETLIAKYLDDIDEAYPPGRKNKIIDRSERFWKGEKAGDRIPYALCKVKSLKGVNFSSSENDLREAFQIKRRDLRIVCHGAPVAKAGLPLRTPLEHAAYCGQCAREAGEDVYCLVANVDESLTPAIDAKIREVLTV
jgi:hypothetical protein